MKDYLLKLVDGNLIDIQSDIWCENHGCPTCAYGSEYITQIDLVLTSYTMSMSVNKMYEYAFVTTDSILKIILRNICAINSMTQLEFIEWFKLEVIKRADTDPEKIEVNVKERNA